MDHKCHSPLTKEYESQLKKQLKSILLSWQRKNALADQLNVEEFVNQLFDSDIYFLIMDFVDLLRSNPNSTLWFAMCIY